jgi:PDZ domain-containing protein
MALPSIERVPGGRAFAALSRRVRTLIVAGVLFVVLFVLALTMPVPYVVLSPGPTLNTLGVDNFGNTIIVIDGREPARSTGHLNLTTVSVSGGSVTAFQALAAWLRHDEVVLPRSVVYPPGKTEQQTNKENTAEFVASQDNATAAALCELKYPRGFGILKVDSDGASHGILQPGDFMVSVDGKAADTGDKLTSVMSSETPGKTVVVAVTRDDKPLSLKVTLGPAIKGRTGASLGVTVGTGCLAPFTVDLGLANQIGGPSAGLMFALGIIDKVGPEDLTGGKFIAGTGEIDEQDPQSGKIDPIGGIQLKMIAAKRKGATVFLAPAGNCSDVRGDTPDGLQVVKVSTLHEAVQDLLKIKQGESVPSC